MTRQELIEAILEGMKRTYPDNDDMSQMEYRSMNYNFFNKPKFLVKRTKGQGLRKQIELLRGSEGASYKKLDRYSPPEDLYGGSSYREPGGSY